MMCEIANGASRMFLVFSFMSIRLPIHVEVRIPDYQHSEQKPCPAPCHSCENLGSNGSCMLTSCSEGAPVKRRGCGFSRNPFLMGADCNYMTAGYLFIGFTGPPGRP
jgi:hypothetical protein